MPQVIYVRLEQEGDEEYLFTGRNVKEAMASDDESPQVIGVYELQKTVTAKHTIEVKE